MRKFIWKVSISGEWFAKFDGYLFGIIQNENTGRWLLSVNGKTLNSSDSLDEVKQIAETFVEKMQQKLPIAA